MVLYHLEWWVVLGVFAAAAVVAAASAVQVSADANQLLLRQAPVLRFRYQDHYIGIGDEN
jgi:hypothetical protein